MGSNFSQYFFFLALSWIFVCLGLLPPSSSLPLPSPSPPLGLTPDIHLSRPSPQRFTVAPPPAFTCWVHLHNKLRTCWENSAGRDLNTFTSTLIDQAAEGLWFWKRFSLKCFRGDWRTTARLSTGCRESGMLASGVRTAALSLLCYWCCIEIYRSSIAVSRKSSEGNCIFCVVVKVQKHPIKVHHSGINQWYLTDSRFPIFQCFAWIDQ